MKKKISKAKEPTLTDVLQSIKNLSTTQNKSDHSLSQSIDNLAIATKNGFDEMHEFRDEMLDFKKETSLTLFNVDIKLKDVDDRLREIEKSTGSPLRMAR